MGRDDLVEYFELLDRKHDAEGFATNYRADLLHAPRERRDLLSFYQCGLHRRKRRWGTPWIAHSDVSCRASALESQTERVLERREGSKRGPPRSRPLCC